MQQEQQQQKRNKTETKPRRKIVLQDGKDITHMTIETRRETRKQIGKYEKQHNSSRNKNDDNRHKPC